MKITKKEIGLKTICSGQPFSDHWNYFLWTKLDGYTIRACTSCGNILVEKGDYFGDDDHFFKKIMIPNDVLNAHKKQFVDFIYKELKGINN